jgi:hypothetical protein
MTNFIKKAEGTKASQGSCCGPEAKEASASNEETSSSSCCGIDTNVSSVSFCCNVDAIASNNSCCG